MGIKEIVNGLKKKRDKKKEMLEQAKLQDNIQKKVEDMKKSTNERELEMLMEEEREKAIENKLKALKKRKKDDIRFNHNPLDTKNITNSTEWEVMKERNMFKNNNNMFANEKNLFTNGRNLFTSKSKKKEDMKFI